MLNEIQAPDSVSFLPLLRNVANTGRRKTLVVQGALALAFHSWPWKLAFCPDSGCEGCYGNVPAQEDA